nr:uncharacterized protein I203_04888 [Kwoniella mangroviensis CBS 8507]OCF65868.1 hypothetical protein I203_04888 [Kwoniella mangroviensis CBS 8507]
MLKKFAVAATFLLPTNIGGIGVGCFDREAILEGATGIYLYSGANPPEVPCNCQEVGYDYSWTWGQYGGVGIYESCYCTNTRPGFRYLLNSYDYCSPELNHESDASVVAVATRVNGWSSGPCVHPDSPISTFNPFEVSDIFQCVSQCQIQGRPYAVLIPHRRSITATCACFENSDVWLVEPSAGCGWENWNTFSYISHPSAFVKHQQAKHRLTNRDGLCPVDSTACLLAGSESSYECLDTDSELESCGGCIHSSIIALGDTPAGGVDCTSLPGAAPDGVTCLEGRCIVYDCDEGYELENGECVSPDL